MSKKAAFFIIVAIFLFGHRFAFAGIKINEIMPTPTAKQWVEIYNDGDSSVDISKYKILDSGALVNGHGIAIVGSGSSVVEGKSYALLSKVPEDFAGTAYNLFKSALGIKAAGDTVILKDGSGNIADSAAVAGGVLIDENSLQLIDGAWVASVPTPGSQNKISAVAAADDELDDDDPADTDGDNEISAESTNTVSSETAKTSSSKKSSSRSSKKTAADFKPKVTITVPKIAYVGIPFDIVAEAFSGSDTRINYGKYFWNFGDGNTTEKKKSETFTYIYAYEGDYIISLEYYMTSSSKIPDASAKIAVKIIPNDISISRIGDEKDFFVELANNTNYQTDISGWYLSSANKKFIFPKNTNILSKKKIVFSSKVTGFSIADNDNLKLNTSQNEIAYNYAPSVALTAVPGSSSPNKLVAIGTVPKNLSIEGTQSTAFKSRVQRVVPTSTATVATGDGQTLALDIPALPLASDMSSDSARATPNFSLASAPVNAETASISSAAEGKNNSFLPIVASVIFIGISASAVYFIRQRKPVSESGIPRDGSDFNILD